MTPEERALDVCCKPGRGPLYAPDMSPFPNDRRLNMVYQVYPSDIADAIREAEAAARTAAFEEAAKIAEGKVDDFTPVPCPDGEPSCLVLHQVAIQRPRTWREIASAIRQHAKGDGKS